MTLLSDFVHLFYPNLCCGCEYFPVTGHEYFCMQCTYDCPTTNFHREAENESLERLAGKLPLVHGAGMYRFTPGGKVQHLIHMIKYRSHRKAAERIGTSYGTMLRDSMFPQDPILLPVPLHKRKRRDRGYNQSLHFALGISSTTGWMVSKDVLVRIRDTKTQTAMTREERLENLKGAFELKKPNAFIGRDVILVDDILTTGATLEACADVLLNHCKSLSFATIGLAV